MQNWPIEFDALTTEEKQRLESYLQHVQHSAEACLFRAGDSGDSAFIIDEGKLRLELEQDELDSENVITTMGSGTLLGELVLLDKQPRSVSAFAETELSLYMLTEKALATLVSKHTDLAVKVYAALGVGCAHKLRQTNQRMSEALVLSHGSMPSVDRMVETATQAQKQLAAIDEASIDKVLSQLCEAILEKAENLASKVVKQTTLGNIQDKATKHRNVCLGVYSNIVGRTGHGIVGRKRRGDVTELGDAMGVVFGLIPVTNPVSTACFKSMISLKSRNAIILSPNRLGSAVVIETVDIIRAVLKKHGLPEDAIQVVRERSNRVLSNAFMHHKGIALILATGGAAMVQAAYRSGTPAIGVGAGNTPCLIAADADISHAAKSIVRSKSFDNGLICGSEHNLIVVESVREKLIAALEREGAAILLAEEIEPFTSKVIAKKTGHLGRIAIGQDADKIADKTGIKRDYPIRLLIVPSESISADNPWAKEKMAPVLSLFTVADDQAGLDAAEQILHIEGCGHTAVIHTKNRQLAKDFGSRVPAARILVNSPAMQGIVGLCTGLEPSLTLGCGSYGGNSTTDNVSYQHLMNIKRIAWFLPRRKLEEHLARVSHSSTKLLMGIRLLGFMRRMFNR